MTNMSLTSHDLDHTPETEAPPPFSENLSDDQGNVIGVASGCGPNLGYVSCRGASGAIR